MHARMLDCDNTGNHFSRKFKCSMWLVSFLLPYLIYQLVWLRLQTEEFSAWSYSAEVLFEDFKDVFVRSCREAFIITCNLNYELTGLLQCGWEGTSVFGLMRSNLDRASSSICCRCCSKGKSPYVKNLRNILKTLLRLYVCFIHV